MRNGATKADILRQFLTESLLQRLLGGAVGIAIGLGCAMLLRTLTSFPASVKTWVALLGLLVSSTIWVILWYLSGPQSRRLGSRNRAAIGGMMMRSELFENMAVALDTLRARKVRSALTIRGIVIGVTTVIAVASIIDGLNGEIKERVQKLGSNTLFVTRIPAMQNASRLTAKIRVRKYLLDEDAGYIQDTSPAVSYATVFANRINFNEQSDEIRFGDAHVERFFLRGVQPGYIKAFPLFEVAEGRFISAFDDEHARSVVVSGRSLADSLFPSRDPLGKEVRLDGRLYEVIGFFAPDQGLF